MKGLSSSMLWVTSKSLLNPFRAQYLFTSVSVAHMKMNEFPIMSEDSFSNSKSSAGTGVGAGTRSLRLSPDSQARGGKNSGVLAGEEKDDLED